VRRRRFVVLDRDGTIVVERHYLSDPAEIALIPGAGGALRRLAEMDLGLVMITNQSAIGRGLLDAAGLDRIHERLAELLRDEGVSLDAIYACPHVPEDRCLCRKPGTALLERAAGELGFDPATSFVIGDKACDIDLGRRAGATTLLVETGYGAQTASDPAVAPDYVVGDLGEAARVIEGLLAGQRPAAAAVRIEGRN
jgi:histidinol-phosphate phosphatase family protein